MSDSTKDTTDPQGARPDAFASGDVALLRRNRALLAAGVAPLLLGVLLGVLSWFGQSVDAQVTAGLWSAFFSFIGLISSATVWRMNPRPVGVTRHVEAGERGVTWGGRLLAPQESITGGFLVPVRGGRPLVRIERRWPHRSLTLRVPDEPTGRALLQGLGMDASQVTAMFVFASPARADARITALGTALLLAMLLVGLPVAAVVGAEGAAVPAAIATLGAFVLALRIAIEVLPVRLTVGADGLLVTGLGRRRFIRYEELRAVRPFGSGASQGVSLWLASGKPVKLPLRGRLAPGQRQEQIRLVMERIRQGLSASRARGGAGEVVLPEQGERAPDAWVGALRAVGAGANADHRTAPLESEQLWRIVEDPSATPSRRGAAAVALGGALDEAGRARLRISAQATASPEMRELLELAAEDAAEAEVGEALAKLSGRS